LSIKKAVFPAAGLGTRFLPATKASPKEMLPVVDKPVIQYVVEEAVESGIEHVVMVTGRGKRAIEDHFDIAFELESMLKKRGKIEALDEIRAVADMVQVSYMRQKEPLGLGHAILVTKDLIGNEAFAVFLGDDLVSSDVPCMRQMIDVYNRYKCSVLAVERVPKSEVKNYGVVEAQEVEEGTHRVINLVEKPNPEDAPSDLAIIGRYILTPEIFTTLKDTGFGSGGEIQLTDALKSLLKSQPIYAYEFKGKRYDTGSKLGFLKATVEFALKREDLGGEFRDYLRGLNLNTDKH